MKKYYIISFVVLLSIILASCSDNTTNPPAVGEKGSIFISSSPTGAAISVDGTNQNKITPDSVTDLSAGPHTVSLSLSGYKDTSFTVTVVANLQTTKNVTLVSSLDVTTFGPVKIYESADPSANDPSGLDLSTGNAIAISTADSVNCDIYYSTTGVGGQGYLVQSASLNNHMHRETFFKVGTSTDLNDHVSSATYPLNGPWTNFIADTETNYVFLYDDDGHYSKLVITDMGGGTPGNPAWLEVKWIYNNTGADTRF